MKRLWFILLALFVGALGLVAYLFRPLGQTPTPAVFECFDLSRGSYVELEAPDQAYGVGLSYADHIIETASDFHRETPPPVFEKHPRALTWDGDTISMPSSAAIYREAERLQPGLESRLRDEIQELPALLDYETELGLVLLEDVDPDELNDDGYAPAVGFFIANDLSVRTLAILGEGQSNRYEYWGASKSFPGLMPVGATAWVPDEARPRGLPCVLIRTLVNGELRQAENTRNLIYTPAEMLRFIQAKYPDRTLRKGDIVLTGTPGGVAAHVPRYLLRLANLVGLDRFDKLEAALRRDRSRYLSEGDVVVVEGEGLGSVTVTIAAPNPSLDATTGR